MSKSEQILDLKIMSNCLEKFENDAIMHMVYKLLHNYGDLKQMWSKVIKCQIVIYASDIHDVNSYDPT